MYTESIYSTVYSCKETTLTFLERRGAFFVLLFSLLVGCTGCYHLGKVCPSSMRNVHTLAIPMFQNSTLIPRIEALLADITTRTFQVDGSYEIVNESKADAILKCRIVNVSRTALLLSPGNLLNAKKFQLQVLVNYQVFDKIANAILQQGTVVGTTSYFVGEGDPISQEHQELPVAAHSMAASLVSQLTEGW